MIVQFDLITPKHCCLCGFNAKTKLALPGHKNKSYLAIEYGPCFQQHVLNLSDYTWLLLHNALKFILTITNYLEHLAWKYTYIITAPCNFGSGVSYRKQKKIISKMCIKTMPTCWLWFNQSSMCINQRHQLMYF